MSITYGKCILFAANGGLPRAVTPKDEKSLKKLLGLSPDDFTNRISLGGLVGNRLGMFGVGTTTSDMKPNKLARTMIKFFEHPGYAADPDKWNPRGPFILYNESDDDTPRDVDWRLIQIEVAQRKGNGFCLPKTRKRVQGGSKEPAGMRAEFGRCKRATPSSAKVISVELKEYIDAAEENQLVASLRRGLGLSPTTVAHVTDPCALPGAFRCGNKVAHFARVTNLRSRCDLKFSPHPGEHYPTYFVSVEEPFGTDWYRTQSVCENPKCLNGTLRKATVITQHPEGMAHPPFDGFVPTVEQEMGFTAHFNVVPFLRAMAQRSTKYWQEHDPVILMKSGEYTYALARRMVLGSDSKSARDGGSSQPVESKKSGNGLYHLDDAMPYQNPHAKLDEPWSPYLDTHAAMQALKKRLIPQACNRFVPMYGVYILDREWVQRLKPILNRREHYRECACPYPDGNPRCIAHFQGIV